eukprot:5628041-Prymnesium_polylepis.1
MFHNPMNSCESSRAPAAWRAVAIGRSHLARGGYWPQYYNSLALGWRRWRRCPPCKLKGAQPARDTDAPSSRCVPADYASFVDVRDVAAACLAALT